MTSPAQQAVLDSMADTSQRAIIGRYLAGSLSAQMALMYCMQKTPDFDALIRLLKSAQAAGMDTGATAHTQALARLEALAWENQDGCRRITGMLNSGVDSDAPAANVDEGIAFCKRLFNWSVAQCAEASVALYSLGDPAILAAATGEIVAAMQQWQLLGSRRRLLEIGCGIGRFQNALAGQVQSIAGIDVSAGMIAVARERCAGSSNIVLHECSGRDLQLFPDGAFDFVFAVDSFPYLYQSGMTLVEAHFREVRRVLRAGGDFLILEFSYRNDPAADRRDVERLARPAFDIVVDGAHPFKLWDGTAFHLRAR